MERRIVYKNEIITYELSRKRVKNINLRVRNDGTICVSCPRSVAEGYMDRFVISKIEFIKKTRTKIETNKRANKVVNGEEFTILNKRYTLRIEKGKSYSITIKENEIYLTVKDINDYEKNKRYFLRYIKKLAEKVINKICEKVYKEYQQYVVEYPTIKFRYMTSRWGSCNKTKQTLTFNYALIFLTLEQIEYVVYHEFTHFIEPNHSKKFYERLKQFMPNYYEIQKSIKGERIITIE